MSATIDVIQSGYSYEILDTNKPPIGLECPQGNSLINNSPRSRVQKACGSCCLVRSTNLIILFDTMGPWEKDLLLQKLQNLKIHPDEIHYVIGSHGHADHIGNLNLFSKCDRQFVGICSYFKDEYYADYFNEEVKSESEGSASMDYTFSHKPCFTIDKNTSVISTPGHTNDDVSLVIENCDKYGKVALAGDLFECEQDVEDESIWLGAGSANPIVQRRNRRSVYSMVDWILPGHGPIFKTNKASSSYLHYPYVF